MLSLRWRSFGGLLLGAFVLILCSPSHAAYNDGGFTAHGDSSAAQTACNDEANTVGLTCTIVNEVEVCQNGHGGNESYGAFRSVCPTGQPYCNNPHYHGFPLDNPGFEWDSATCSWTEDSGGGGSSSGGGSGGTCQVIDNRASLQCNSQLVIDEHASRYSDAPLAPGVYYTNRALTNQERADNAVIVGSEVQYDCFDVPTVCDLEEVPIWCASTLTIIRDLDADMNVQTTYQRQIGQFQVDIGGSLACQNNQVDSNPVTLAPADFGTTEETEVIDQNGDVQYSAESCYQTRTYNESDGRTRVCDVCLVEGVATQVDQQCTYEAGDTTNDQQGETGTGTSTDGGQTVTGGTPGVVVGTDGTGTDSDGNTTGSTGTGDNAELIDALGRLEDAINNQELEGGCDDPNGCEDFQEIIEQLDSGLLTEAYANSIISYDEYVALAEADLQSFTENPDSAFTGDTNSAFTTIDTFDDFLVVGQCQDASYALPGGFDPVQIKCSDLQPIKNLLTISLYLLMLLHLKNVITRPSAVAG